VGRVIPRAVDRPTLSIPEVARLIGVSKSHAYQMATEGMLPVMRLGRRVVVKTGALLVMLGLDDSTHADD
jgi:excisionase family DNA binding protein